MVRRFPLRAIFLGGAGLRWREYEPDPRLSPWVATVWTLACEVSVPLRVLPDGCMDLIGRDLVGTLTAPLLADLRAGDVSCGVRLRPGAFTALFGLIANTRYLRPTRSLRAGVGLRRGQRPQGHQQDERLGRR
jgi:Domain of unknown function (DUF6597)